MIKKILLISALTILLIIQVNAQDKEMSFKDGEWLLYKMYYGWITGGEASLRLKKEKLDGKEVFHATALGKTIGITHAIYHVYDVYESWFDVNTCLPYKSLMDLTEGSWTKDNVVYFNQASHTLNSKRSGTKDIGKHVYDMVSAFYYIRENVGELEKGEVLEIFTYFHDKPWNMIIRYKGIETIKTGLGRIECMRFKPVVEKDVFEDEDALDIWISHDENKIPIRVKMKLFVGSFKTDLVEYKGLKYPLNFF